MSGQGAAPPWARLNCSSATRGPCASANRRQPKRGGGGRPVLQPCGRRAAVSTESVAAQRELEHAALPSRALVPRSASCASSTLPLSRL